jgi:hypothetical protein
LDGILNAQYPPETAWCLNSEDWNIGIRSATPFTLEDSYWQLLWTAILQCIGPMSADQHKPIGIRRGARSFQLVLLSKLKTLKNHRN